jgi:hypothetical protein
VDDDLPVRPTKDEPWIAFVGNATVGFNDDLSLNERVLDTV